MKVPTVRMEIPGPTMKVGHGAGLIKTEPNAQHVLGWGLRTCESIGMGTLKKKRVEYQICTTKSEQFGFPAGESSETAQGRAHTIRSIPGSIPTRS